MSDLNSSVIAANQYIFNHKKEFNKELGGVLREIRNQKGITTEEMANLTLMSTSYIIQLENGVNGITLSKFVIICNALQIEPKEILENFLYVKESNEELLYDELQNGKNISQNILSFMKMKDEN